MSNEVYPTFPGITFNVHRVSMWKTGVRTTPSGREFRTSQQTYPRRRLTLEYEFLRTYGAFTDLQSMDGFFNRHKGGLDTFLLVDPIDNAVTAQALGLGDGSTKVFQLARSFGGYIEPVKFLNGTPQIYVNGVLRTAGTDYTIGAGGVVTFTNAPGAGLVVSWTGSYYWRARFKEDELDFQQLLAKIWKLGKVELITIKDLV